MDGDLHAFGDVILVVLVTLELPLGGRGQLKGDLVFVVGRELLELDLQHPVAAGAIIAAVFIHLRLHKAFLPVELFLDQLDRVDILGAVVFFDLDLDVLFHINPAIIPKDDIDGRARFDGVVVRIGEAVAGAVHHRKPAVFQRIPVVDIFAHCPEDGIGKFVLIRIGVSIRNHTEGERHCQRKGKCQQFFHVLSSFSPRPPKQGRLLRRHGGVAPSGPAGFRPRAIVFAVNSLISRRRGGSP